MCGWGRIRGGRSQTQIEGGRIAINRQIKKYLFQGLNLKRGKILDLGDEGWRVYMPWYVMRYGVKEKMVKVDF